MDHHSENAARTGGEFGIHEKAWQLIEYQTHKIDAIGSSVDTLQSIGELSRQVVLECFITRHRLNYAVGRVLFEQAGLGRRAV